MKLGNEAVRGMPDEVREAMEIVADHLGVRPDSDSAMKCGPSPECKTIVPDRVAAEYSRMVQIAMAGYGNESMAVAAVGVAFSVSAEMSDRMLTVNSHVSQVLKMRTSNELEHEGVETIGELIALTPQELLRFHNFGWKVVSDIQTALEPHGFRLMGK